MKSADFGKNRATGKHSLCMPQPFRGRLLSWSIPKTEEKPKQYEVGIYYQITFELIFILKRDHIMLEKCSAMLLMLELLCG